MDEGRWCLAGLGLVFSVFFLATQSAAAPLATFTFCCSLLIVGTWLRIAGVVLILLIGLISNFFLEANAFPWMLVMGQVSLAVNTVLAHALLTFSRRGTFNPKHEFLPEKRTELMLETVHRMAAVLPHIEKVVEKEIVIQREVVVEYQKEYVEVPDVQRLHLLNEIRSKLWEKELLLEHLVEENKKLQAHLTQAKATIEDLEGRMLQHPDSIAHRELRKQFSEKADALHRIRTQMFSLEGEFLVLQREQEEIDCERITLIADLMMALGEAEIAREQQEEHIMALEQYVKRSLPKRSIRRKKDEGQAELFVATPPPVKPIIRKNRKKRVASSPYLYQ